MNERQNIAFILFDQALALNLHGPAEVFGRANHLLDDGGGGYDLFYLSEAGGSVRTSSGIMIQTQILGSIDMSSIDTLIVVGGSGADAFMPDSPLINWIREASLHTRRTCSVCNAAFLLAAAGLLDDRRATGHWCEIAALRAMYPSVRVESDPIYLRDGPIWTSAGMTAGIDLALALIEEDHGRSLSLQVAKEMVVFLQRGGSQRQFSSTLAAQTRLGTSAPASKLASLPAWIAGNLNADLSVDGLAKAVGMTPRTFARNFALCHDDTPSKLVEDIRVESACQYLEDGQADIQQIAFICGFGNDERMRRAFLRRIGVAPAVYRERLVLGAVSNKQAGLRSAITPVRRS